MSNKILIFTDIGRIKIKCKCSADQLHVSRHRVGVQVQLNLQSTPALEGGRWSVPSTGRFNPGKEILYPLYMRLIGPQGPGWVRKISTPPMFEPRTIQPVATRYTDAIPTT
jgi:hypothetical protein